MKEGAPRGSPGGASEWDALPVRRRRLARCDVCGSGQALLCLAAQLSANCTWRSMHACAHARPHVPPAQATSTAAGREKNTVQLVKPKAPADKHNNEPAAATAEVALGSRSSPDAGGSSRGARDKGGWAPAADMASVPRSQSTSMRHADRATLSPKDQRDLQGSSGDEGNAAVISPGGSADAREALWSPRRMVTDLQQGLLPSPRQISRDPLTPRHVGGTSMRARTATSGPWGAGAARQPRLRLPGTRALHLGAEFGRHALFHQVLAPGALSTVRWPLSL